MTLPEWGRKVPLLAIIPVPQLVTYIKETVKESDSSPVFKMADLTKLYTERMKQLVLDKRVHTEEADTDTLP